MWGRGEESLAFSLAQSGKGSVMDAAKDNDREKLAERTGGREKRRRQPRGAVKSLISAVRMTERDVWILEALTKMRFLTTSQMAQLFFDGSQWSANKRLRRLFDAGVVQVWMRSLAQENVYSVTQRGLQLLAEQEEDTDNGGIAPRGLDGNLDHLLAINQVRIALALALPTIGAELTWWRSDWELRAHGRERIIPDALFGIGWEQDSAQAVALEVDNHTKSPRKFVQKILAYTSRRQQHRGLYGLSDMVVLVVGRDPYWVERYRLGLETIQVDEWVWCTTWQAISNPGMLAPIWHPPGDAHCYSLQELKSLPYGKEGSSHATPALPGA
jgi:protein involved in plasmid replication-relaxation